MEQDFDPQIIAFCCKYCAYAAGDLAGSMRLDYPANIKVVQVPCSGRVDSVHLLRAIESGADAVYVAGCLAGECHFLEGNLRALKKVAYVQRILAQLGIDPQRVQMFNLSSAMGQRFAEIAAGMTMQTEQMGPSPLRAAAGSHGV